MTGFRPEDSSTRKDGLPIPRRESFSPAHKSIKVDSAQVCSGGTILRPLVLSFLVVLGLAGWGAAVGPAKVNLRV